MAKSARPVRQRVVKTQTEAPLQDDDVPLIFAVAGKRATLNYLRARQVVEDGEDRYLDDGDVSGLDDAIDAWRAILAKQRLKLLGDRFWLPVKDGVATTYRLRYEALGHPADLDRALNLWRQALTHTRPGSPDHAACLNNLGIGLSARYAVATIPHDLDRAIDSWKEAAAHLRIGARGRNGRESTNKRYSRVMI